MRTKTYIVKQPPTPWQRARINGNRFFDGQKDLKVIYGIYLQQQHDDEPLFSRPIEMDITFYMPTPLAVEFRIRKKKNEIDAYHRSRPDLDNMIKFCLDAIKDVLITDDKIIYAITARKVYDDDPRTEFTIKEI